MAKLLRTSLEQLPAVEHSLFESAEYPAMDADEVNSKRSPNSPSIGSQRAQPRLLLEIPQAQERLQLTHFEMPRAVAKTRGRQPEPRYSLSRDSRARFRRGARETGQPRQLLRRATARQSAVLFETGAQAELRVAAELLF